MKKTLGLLALIFIGSNFAFAQERGDREGKPNREKMELLFKAFLVGELELEEDESQAFWVEYDQWQASENSIKKELRQLKKGHNGELSEEEALTEIDRHAELEHKIINERTAFLKRSVDIIGPEKTSKFLAAKKKFKKVVMNKMKENRPPRPSDR